MTSRLQTLLHDYVAGDLDEARVAEVETLLAESAKARRLHGEIRRAHEALVILRDRPAPPVTAEGVRPITQKRVMLSLMSSTPRTRMVRS